MQAEVVPDPIDGQQMNPNMWASKPAWCQPWTILLTGTGIMAAAYKLSSSLLWTGLAAVPVLAWWALFLIVVPKQYRQHAEEVNARTRI